MSHAPRFNRHIGEHAHKPYNVHGELLDERVYVAYIQEMLPQSADLTIVEDIQSLDKHWISPKGAIQ